MLELPPGSEAVVSSSCNVSFTASSSSMCLKPCAFVLSALLQNHSFGCFVKSQAADDCERLKRAPASGSQTIIVLFRLPFSVA